MLAHRPARHGSEGDGLQDRQRAREAGYAQDPATGADGPVGAHDEGERAQELGHVDALRDITGGHGAAGLPDEPDLARTVAQDVVGRQVAVGDLMLVQGAHRAPCLLEIVIGDLVRVEIAEARGDRVLVGEERGVGADLAGEEQSRDGRMRSLRGVRHERGMVELATHVEGAPARLVAQAQGLPGGTCQSRTLEVAVEHDNLE